MPDLVLRGCRTNPLISYLKALGVGRIVGLADPGLRMSWTRDGFAVLRTRLDEELLVGHLMDDYQPAPITSPWNGGSGYYPGDNTDAIAAVRASTSPRLGDLRETIALGDAMVRGIGGQAAPAAGPAKNGFIEGLRAQCGDAALRWLDAAWALTEDGASANPLLGTGGNDGRFEFSRNYLDRLTQCLPHLFGDEQASRESSASLLQLALFAVGTGALGSDSTGMFAPGLNGLPNSSSTSGTRPLSNPWDFVLMLEGTLLFASGVARRLGTGRATFPFTMADIAAAGTAVADGENQKSRGEIWLPVWSAPASMASVQRLFAEGRSQDGARQSRSGREAARAATGLGVERGVDSFARIVFAERNGLSYAAVPVDQVRVGRIPLSDLLREADGWLTRVRRIDAPAVRAAVNRVDRAGYVAATDPDGSLTQWLVALAHTEMTLSLRPTARDQSAKTHVPPLSGLPAGLSRALPNASIVRLARALASGQSGGLLRTLVEPVESSPRGIRWNNNGGSARRGALLQPSETLIRLADLQTRFTEGPGEGAALDDVLTMLQGGVDSQSLIELAFALTLCRTTAPDAGSKRRVSGIDRLYAVCRLATVPIAIDDGQRPPATDVIPALRRGDVAGAVRAATRQLRAAGRNPLTSLSQLPVDRPHGLRVAAALAVPLHPADLVRLERIVLKPTSSPALQPEGTTS